MEEPLLSSIGSTQSYDMASIKVFKKRGVMLGLFLLFGIANSIQYSQYTVVTNLMASYYGVSDLDIAWSTLIYMATYVVFNFPGLYVMEKLGIRKTLITGAIGMTIGSWIKVIAVKPTLYWLAFTGQALVALFQIFVLPIPPKVAAMWFSDNEVATACSAGVAAPQFGIALGFLFTPLLIHKGTKEAIENGLFLSMTSNALFCTLVAIAIFFFYVERPPKPPSLTQLQAVECRIMEKSAFSKVAKHLITNKSFVLFIIVFGINLGIFITYSVFLNEITLHYYPSASSVDVGILGVLAGSFLVIGTLLSGIVIDKLKNYRLLILIEFALNIIAFSLVSIFVGDALWLFKVFIVLFGFGIGCLFPLGYEVAVELTYPEPEEISGGFLSCSIQLFGVVLSCFYNLLYKYFGFTCANFTMVGAILLTDILLLCINFDFRRQTAINNINYLEL